MPSPSLRRILYQPLESEASRRAGKQPFKLKFDVLEECPDKAEPIVRRERAKIVAFGCKETVDTTLRQHRSICRLRLSAER